MDPVKFKADAKGKFYVKKTYNPPLPDKLPWKEDDQCKDTFEVKLKGKLIKPKETNVQGTITINKKVEKFKGTTGKQVNVGPFVVSPCDNIIEFEGTSDKPGEEHVIEVDQA